MTRAHHRGNFSLQIAASHVLIVSLVHDQCTLLCEHSPAHVARVSRGPGGVRAQVLRQAVVAREGRGALCAFELPLSCVDARVSVAMAGGLECHAAHGAREVALAGVDTLVDLETRVVADGGAALVAGVSPPRGRRSRRR